VTYAVDLTRAALGQPIEFSPTRSLMALGLTVLGAFALAVFLFDPEQRMSARTRK
jgi:hypothetical protein